MKLKLSTMLVAFGFLVCGSSVRAATLNVSLEVVEVSGAITGATLDLVSSAVPNFATYSGTLVSSTSGDLNNGGTDSTLVTVGADGSIFDLVQSHAGGIVSNPFVVTTITLDDGVLASITFSSGLGIYNYIISPTGEFLLSVDPTYQLDVDSPGGAAVDAALIFPAPTPLPGALPLFATGISALTFLGWRRKRNLAQISN